MPDARYVLPRAVAPVLDHAARVMPAVILTGARQTGKSTLAREFTNSAQGAHQRIYVTLDVAAMAALAQNNPAAFVRQAENMVIDEVQRDPDLLLAVKEAIDNDLPRRPGRFILTGSANLALMHNVRDSLAGRAAYVTLHSLARREQLGFGSAGIWSQLLAAAPQQWREIVEGSNAPEEDWRALARRGGYPPAAYEMSDDKDRAVWFAGYLNTYLQRDVPDLSRIENVAAFDTVLRSMALRTGTIVNVTQLARDASLPQTTVQRYLSLLETSYQVSRLHAFVGSRTRQLVKSPKFYWSDTGLALSLSREKDPRGEHFENIVLQDLLVWQAAQTVRPDLFYWRTAKGYEVDFVIQDGQRILPVEVKTTTQPSTGDLASMKVFLADYADRAPAGLILHTGDQTFWIAKNILAVPWWRVA